MAEESIYQETTYRFVISILFILGSMQNAIIWIACSPIMNSLKDIYSASTFVISLPASMYMITFIPINLPSNYIIDKYGLKAGFLIGMSCTMIGGWVRVFCRTSFGYVILGNGIAGLGQPFILNSPAKIAALWFRPEKRAMATTMMSLANSVGLGLGFLLPGLFLGASNGEEGKDRFFSLMLFQACLGTFLTLPSFCFLQSKPTYPPSSSAQITKSSFVTGLLNISPAKSQFTLVFIFFLCLLGNYNTIATIIVALISPFGFGDAESGYLGFVIIISGIVGAIVMGTIVGKTSKFKLTLLGCGVGSMMSICGLGLSLHIQSIALVLLSLIIMGFFTTPIIPLSLEFICELTFPVGEALACGILMAASQIGGLLILTLYSNVFDSGSMNEVHGFLGSAAGIAGIGILMLLFVKERLRRREHDDGNSSLIS